MTPPPTTPFLLLLGCLLAGGCSNQPAADEPLVQRLLRQIETIPLTDSHTHVPLPGVIQGRLADGKFHYDIVYELADSTYVSRLMPGKDWEHIKPGVMANAQNAYYRPFVLAWRDLYGFGPQEELNDGNVETLSQRMDRAHRDPAWCGEILRRANVRHMLWMNYHQSGNDYKRPENQLAHTSVHPVWNIDDTLVYITGKYPPTRRAAAGFKITLIEARQGVKLASLDDMEAMIENSLARFFESGGVGLKTTSAYFRSLDFNDEVPRDQAAAVFAKVVAHETPSESEQRLLEDYLMTKVLESANRHKAPFQFHTGNQQLQNIIANSNPLLLNRLINSGKYPDVKFVLLHGGNPFTQEAVMLATYYRSNVYLELAWMPLFSPAAAKQTLSEALDMLGGTRIMMGTDSVNLEELYGTAKITRRILAEVLAEKIESGLWTEEVALQAARRVLYQNAVDLYGLEGNGQRGTAR